MMGLGLSSIPNLWSALETKGLSIIREQENRDTSEIIVNSNRKTEEFIQYHKDGSVWAKGQVIDNTPTGYWEWFRKGGTLMRSGHFLDGIQVGKWITFDKNGDVYKVTDKKDGEVNTKRTIFERS